MMDMPRQPALPDPTSHIAALMSMMTRFSCLGCPRLARRIQRNLALLQHYADDDMPPILKQLALRLEREWAQLFMAIADEAQVEESSDECLKHRHEQPHDQHDKLIRPASQSLH